MALNKVLTKMEIEAAKARSKERLWADVDNISTVISRCRRKFWSGELENIWDYEKRIRRLTKLPGVKALVAGISNLANENIWYIADDLSDFNLVMQFLLAAASINASDRMKIQAVRQLPKNLKKSYRLSQILSDLETNEKKSFSEKDASLQTYYRRRRERV